MTGWSYLGYLSECDLTLVLIVLVIISYYCEYLLLRILVCILNYLCIPSAYLILLPHLVPPRP